MFGGRKTLPPRKRLHFKKGQRRRSHEVSEAESSPQENESGRVDQGDSEVALNTEHGRKEQRPSRDVSPASPETPETVLDAGYPKQSVTTDAGPTSPETEANVDAEKSIESVTTDARVASPQNEANVDAAKSNESVASHHQDPLRFHDYASPCLKDRGTKEANVVTELPLSACEPPDTSVLEEAQKKINVLLPSNWITLLDDEGLTCILLSRIKPQMAQRHVFFHYSGSVDLSVHGKPVTADSYVDHNVPSVPLDAELMDEFVGRAVGVINCVRLMEVCAGREDYKEFWESTPGIIDRNSFNETRYVETLRSFSCSMLVRSTVWVCDECKKLLRILKRKSIGDEKENLNMNTANKCLSEKQLRMKVDIQRKALEASRLRMVRLNAKFAAMVKNEAVGIDADLSGDLSRILSSSCEFSPAQEVFLQQQIKASQKNKNMCGMRWHPTMIRLALSIHLASPAAYELLRETGMVHLPSSRTLFDYSHVKPVEEGIDTTVLESVAGELKDVKPYQKYVVLIADEMYISKNLVFKKSSGEMIGYTKLDGVDREVRAFNKYLDDPDSYEGPSEEIAYKVLCYMIKGTAVGIKQNVASYAVSNPSPHQMYLWTWQVICALESHGIRVIAFVCDASTTNRSFIKLHTPVSDARHGLVYDTVNKAAPDRVLYFMSDVAHLLKTIRNCFYTSRRKKCKNGRRCMTKGNQKIVWDYIIRLFKEDKHRNLRLVHKLNPANVFPDSFTCMKVSYAAQVLSDSVAKALKKKNYDGVGETVTFIRNVNEWFDRLNGAHSIVGKKRKNVDLNPYRSKDDPRFEKLLGFLQYLKEWKEEAYSAGEATITSPNCTLGEASVDDGEAEFQPCEDIAEDCVTTSEKRILSHQTQLGIEMTTRAFIKCVSFLLDRGTKYVNARVFSQDPLEQFFSKQRAGGGGSSNPNVSQFLNKNRLIHVSSTLNMKFRKGNSSEVCESPVEVSVEPLPKRKCIRRKLTDVMSDSE